MEFLRSASIFLILIAMAMANPVEKFVEPPPLLPLELLCGNYVCGTMDHCTTVIKKHPISPCCSMCGCTDQDGKEVEVDDEFILHQKGDSCYQCKCRRRVYYEKKFAECRQLKNKKCEKEKDSFLPELPPALKAF